MKKLLSTVLFLSIVLTMLSSCSTETKNHKQDEPTSESITDNASYAYGERLFKEGLVRFMVDEKYGYMDKNGNTVIECIYDDATDFYNGIAFVCSQDNQILCIDTNGDTIAKISEIGRFITDEYSSAVDSIGFAYKLGLVDKEGNFLYDFNYYLEESYNHLTNAGYVIIKEVAEDNIKYGIYDINKHTVAIPPVYDSLRCKFSDEYIIAKKDGIVQVLNFNGDVVGELPFEMRHLRFSDGYISAPDESTGLYGYADYTGEYVISPKYRSASDFVDGTAAVSLSEGSCYLIDKEEKTLSGTYENIMQDSILQSLYYVSNGNYIGIIYKNGNEILPPKYDTINVQKSGHIIATKGNILSIHNQDGTQIMEYIIPNNYTYSSSLGIYDDGYILIRVADDHKYYDGVIDIDGKLVLGFNYSLC